MNRIIIRTNLTDTAFRGKGNKAIRRSGGKPVDLPMGHSRGMNREEFWEWMHEGKAYQPKRKRNVRRNGKLIRKSK